MKILFLDDARQKNPMRERMNEIVGVGGLFVDADDIVALEAGIEEKCRKIGLPANEVFKWAPAKNHWFRENIVGEVRANFFADVLGLCRDAKAKAIVSVCDTTMATAIPSSSDHEIDAMMLTMERFHTFIDETGLVLVAKPGGGNSEEGKMLAECLEKVQAGTSFVDFNDIALKPMTLPFSHSRILQVSDLICSITTAMVANNIRFAGSAFEGVKPMFITDWRGIVGGTGLKVHPNYIYRNLYHWVLGEEYWPAGSTGNPLPDKNRPYADVPDKY